MQDGEYGQRPNFRGAHILGVGRLIPMAEE